MQALHLVAHTKYGWKGVIAPDSARWLWEHLGLTVPDALACVLMPDHLHLLAPLGVDLVRLRRVVGHHGRRFGARWDWLEPTHARSLQIVARTVRYIVLNPVRAGLVDDPFLWPWSTLRDLAGVVAEPWPGPARVPKTLGRSRSAVLRWVTTDRARVCPPLRSETGPLLSLERLRIACASALRTRPQDIRRRTPTRRLFIDAARSLGPVGYEAIATQCGISARSARARRGRSTPQALAATMACLADPRLQKFDA